jgi:hypothetical protein
VMHVRYVSTCELLNVTAVQCDFVMFRLYAMLVCYSCCVSRVQDCTFIHSAFILFLILNI